MRKGLLYIGALGFLSIPTFMTFNSALAEEISLSEIPVSKERSRRIEQQEFGVRIYYAISYIKGDRFRGSIYAIPGGTSFLTREFCKEMGFDHSVDLKFNLSDDYNSLVGTEVLRYRYGKLQSYVIPPHANELMGRDFLNERDLGYLRHNHRNIRTVRSWNEIQDKLVLPYISKITCEKKL